MPTVRSILHQCFIYTETSLLSYQLQVDQQGEHWKCLFCSQSNSNAGSLPVLDLQASRHTRSIIL